MDESMTMTVAPTPVCRFDPVDHAYYIDGVQVPSITQMLDDMGIIDDTYYTQECSDRGTLIHRLCAEYDLGAIRDPTAVECIWKGWFLAYVAAMRTIKPHIHSVEVARFSLEHRFGGRPDRTLRLWGIDGDLDIKTGAPAAWHGIQTALQAILVAPEMNLPPTSVQRHVLYLRENGKWRLEECKGQRDFVEAYRIIKACCRQ